MAKPAGQHRAGQRDHDQVADGEVARAADDAVDLLGPDLHPAEPDRLLEPGQLLDLLHPADHQRAGQLRPVVHVLDLQPDPDERVGDLRRRPAARPADVLGQPGLGTRTATPASVLLPGVGRARGGQTPNARLNRTSPSTMSRMSGMPLRNCSVRSSPMPNAKPE